MENEKSTSPEEIDWENRRLCSDPACIGVIGPDGRCRECGKPYQGEADEAASAETETAAPEVPEVFESEPAGNPVDDETDGENDSAIDDEEWKNRRLCSDPACIGVIGPDGRCKECGRQAAE